jgi:hypothetical protein
MVLSALTACGGGGSGGGGAPAIQVGTSTVSASTSVVNGAIVSVPVSLILSSPRTDYYRSRWTTHGIIDAALNVNSPASVTINFKPGTSLQPGTYTDQVGLEACSDSACATPIAGSAVTINTTYTVTSVDAAHEPSVYFSQTSVSVQALAIDALVQPTITLPFTLTNFPQGPYLATSITGSAVTGAYIATSSATQGTVTIYVPVATDLEAGDHTATISVTACLDVTCANPVQGSPFQITVDYSIGNTITVAGPNGYTIQAMAQQVESMVWDSVHQLLYVVLPFDSTGTSHIAAIDPVTQTMSAPVALDSSAFGPMAISDDGQFVYVGLSNGTVQRLLLPQLTTDNRIVLPLGLGLYPADVRVAPGAPHTIAVALSGDPFGDIGNEERGVAVFDDNAMRPNETIASGYPLTGVTVDYLQWISGSSLYGSGYGPASNGQGSFFSMAVDTTGISSSTSIGGVTGGRMHYAQKLYTDFGTIFDPVSGEINSTLSSTPNLYGLLPDSISGRLFVSSGMQIQGTIQLQALDLQQLTPLAQILMPPLASQQREWALWGQNGIVIRTAYDLIFVQGSFVSP